MVSFWDIICDVYITTQVCFASGAYFTVRCVLLTEVGEILAMKLPRIVVTDWEGIW